MFSSKDDEGGEKSQRDQGLPHKRQKIKHKGVSLRELEHIHDAR